MASNGSLQFPNETVTQSFPDITLFEFVTEGAVLTLVGLLGIVGNVISLAVLSKPEMRSSVNCGLQGLAFFDSVVLVSSVTMLGMHKLGYRLAMLHWYTFEAFPFVVLVAYPVGLIAQTGSVWTTVGVTVERYVAVCHPLRARLLCTHGRARACGALVAALSVAYNAPRFWEIEVARVTDPAGRSALVARPTNFRMNKLYYKVYYIWLYLFVMYFIPFLSLAVLNLRIWKAVRHANQHRQHLTRKEEKEIGLATMLVCVVSVFLVCNAPALLINVLELFDLFWPALVRVSNLLVTLNSSVNFLVYCAFGRKFRRVFLRMCCLRERGTGLQHTETMRSVLGSSPSCRVRTLVPNGNTHASTHSSCL